MQANDLLEYRNKIIDAFKNGIFLSEYLKKSDNYVLKDVKNFIQEIKLMEDKINLSLFEDIFELPLSANYAKMLINTENLDKNKEFVAEIKDNIRFKRQNKRNEWNRKTNKNADETLNIIEKILDYDINPQKIFEHASKVDNGKSELKFKKSIAESVKLKNEKIAEIKKKEKNK